MKNMKVSVKLITSFSIAIVFAMVIGAVGIFSLRTLNSDYSEAIEENAKPLTEGGFASADLHAVRAELRLAMLFTGDVEKVRGQGVLVQEYLDDFESRVDVFGKTLETPDSIALMNQMMNKYNNELMPGIEKCLTDAENGVSQLELVNFMVNTIKPTVDSISEDVLKISTTMTDALDAVEAASSQQGDTMLFLILALTGAILGVSIALALYLSGIISKPLIAVSAFLKQAGETGDITLEKKDIAVLDKYGTVRDEIGQTIMHTAAFVKHLTNISSALEIVSNGDLRVRVTPLSPKDTLGISLQKMVGNLNGMFAEVDSATTQVTLGASHVADGAQALAAGSSEQAASVTELSEQVSFVNEMANENAKNATTMMDDVEKVNGVMTECMDQMKRMTEAMRLITDKSNSISRTTKVIDDIAFQTNILALNAAVEAARAGQFGKGFAVVAEEVRNLASKSAEAAKKTGDLIESSAESVAEGARLVEKVDESLRAVGQISQSNAEHISNVQAISVKQSEAMEQINAAVDKISLVVHTNSATAQESAAASEEMSGQSDALRQLVGQFKLDTDSKLNMRPKLLGSGKMFGDDDYSGDNFDPRRGGDGGSGGLAGSDNGGSFGKYDSMAA